MGARLPTAAPGRAATVARLLVGARVLDPERRRAPEQRVKAHRTQFR